VATKSKNGSYEKVALLLPLNVMILLLIFGSATSSTRSSPQTPHTSNPQPTQENGVTVPNRPVAPLYKGEQGPQRSEVSEVEFNAASRMVTIKFHVEDPNGYFLPNIRRDNFVVYEDGARQKNVSVEVEHSLISVALLMELGGRYHELNKVLGEEVPRAGRQLLRDSAGKIINATVFVQQTYSPGGTSGG
jgi:hypothetical protein